jgi:sulfur relay (sulfurtransferase) complex TusBCD TusD component (DsrE family)
MKTIPSLLLVGALLVAGFAAPAYAASSDPLFINLTTDDKHRANMAMTFGMSQLSRGHALTLYLNDRNVMIASRPFLPKFIEQQKLLRAAIDKGATVLVCPMCMKQYGVVESDLLPGVRVSNPDLAEAALFKEHTKTLSW